MSRVPTGWSRRLLLRSLGVAGAAGLPLGIAAQAQTGRVIAIDADPSSFYGQMLEGVATRLGRRRNPDVKFKDRVWPTPAEANVALRIGAFTPADADWNPAGLVETGPMIVIGRPDLPILVAAEFGDWLRRSGSTVRLGYSTPINGSGAVALADAVGVEPQFQQVRSVHEALVTRTIDLACIPAADAIGSVVDGTVTAFAVAAEERAFGLMDFPSAGEAGLPLLSATVWSGLYVRGGEDIARWNAALQPVLADPHLIESFGKLGHTPPPDGHRTPGAHAEMLATARERAERVQARLAAAMHK